MPALRIMGLTRVFLPMKQFSLGKEERLRSHPEFKRVMSRGVSRNTDHFRIFIFPNHSTKQHLGITTSKKIGNATRRNRTKRLLREYFRLHKTQLPLSSDILFIAKPGAGQLNYTEICEELKTLLRPDKPCEQNL